METAVSPREFIKRFHLPQLVRIQSAAAQTEPRAGGAPKDGRVQEPDGAGRTEHRVRISAGQACSAGRRHELKDPGWIYAPGNVVATRAADRHASSSGAHRDGLADDETSGSKSLHLLPEDGGGGGPGGPTSLRMLPRVKLQQPARRHQFDLSDWPLNGHTFTRSPAAIAPAEARLGRRQAPAVPKRDDRQSSSSSQQHHGADIKLIPPSKNLTLSKLQLEQPFLLYKAYRKLEVCAYAIDSNNQLNDKSGDPIYFPHNYQGKYFVRQAGRSARAPSWYARRQASLAGGPRLA
jgi:hypothetical protein